MMLFLRKLVAAALFILLSIPSAVATLFGILGSRFSMGSTLFFAFLCVSTLAVSRTLWTKGGSPLIEKRPHKEAMVGDDESTAPVYPTYVPAGFDELNLDARLRKYSEGDCLGRAAEIGQSTGGAIEAGNRDLAWRLLHMQKTLYMQHAAKQSFTTEQTLSLDGRIHARFAEILRDEGKHTDALVHILYWASSYDSISKSVERRIRAYFNRAALEGVDFLSVMNFLEAGLKQREYTEFQRQVSSWRQKE